MDPKGDKKEGNGPTTGADDSRLNDVVNTLNMKTTTAKIVVTIHINQSTK